MKRYISVIGAGEATDRQYELAESVGAEIAGRGHTLVCGGLGGVMEAAAKGANEAGGTTVGILPQDTRSAANSYLTVSIPTGFSHGRNYLVVLSGDAIIAVGGAAGTMSEIGLALKLGRPVVLLESLDVAAVGMADPRLKTEYEPTEAVQTALALLEVDTA